MWITVTLDDAVFNWLQLKYVAEQRPDDKVAQETHDFFYQILEEDFGLAEVQVEQDDIMYRVTFVHEEKERTKQFPVEFVHQLLHDIEVEPKFNE